MLQQRVRLSLLLVHLVSAATLLRSIAFDRWITVLASVLMIAGAFAAQRGRTWGVGLVLATAVAFPVAFLIGIAPAWFALVGLVGALPFMLSWKPFKRFDRGAATLLATLAAIGGTAAAMSWKSVALDVFGAFPSLTPSGYPHHGIALLTTLAVVVGLAAGHARGKNTNAGARVRVDAENDARVRVAESATRDLETVGLLDEESEPSPAKATRRA